MSFFPQEWRSDRLKDLCSVNSTVLSANTAPDFEFPYLEISNVDYFGVINSEEIQKIRFEDAPSRARRFVFKNSTIVSSVRPNLQAVAFFPEDTNSLICSTGFNVVQPDENRLFPKFVYYVLISDYARQHFEATATGVGYPAVGDKDFGTLVLPLPNVDEQMKIATFLDGNCSVIDSTTCVIRAGESNSRPRGILNRQMDALFAYRKSLIHECVTGQRRITDSDLKRVKVHA